MLMNNIYVDVKEELELEAKREYHNFKKELKHEAKRLYNNYRKAQKVGIDIFFKFLNYVTIHYNNLDNISTVFYLDMIYSDAVEGKDEYFKKAVTSGLHSGLTMYKRYEELGGDIL